MAAPKGNKNALGNKGGGRKSAYQERFEAQLLYDLFTTPVNMRALEKKISSRKYTLRDIIIYKVMTGNDRLLAAMFNKIFPSPPRHKQTRSKKWPKGRDLQSLNKRLHKLAMISKTKDRMGVN